MKVLQLTLQVEVADDCVTRAKSMLAVEIPTVVIDSATGIMVGFAVEEIDPAGQLSESAGGDSFPAGVSLRDVPTPYGALPQPTDEELRQARDDHPVVGEDSSNRPELVVDFQKGGKTDASE